LDELLKVLARQQALHFGPGLLEDCQTALGPRGAHYRWFEGGTGYNLVVATLQELIEKGLVRRPTGWNRGLKLTCRLTGGWPLARERQALLVPPRQESPVLVLPGQGQEPGAGVLLTC
jgi:hypothetical protein